MARRCVKCDSELVDRVPDDGRMVPQTPGPKLWCPKCEVYRE